MFQITINIEDVESFRIVCGECEKRAEILWHTVKPSGLPFVCALACVRCHGETRIVEITQFHARVAEHDKAKHIALLLEQLPPVNAKKLATDLQQRAAEARSWLANHPNDQEHENIGEYIASVEKQLALVLSVASATSVESPPSIPSPSPQSVS